MADRDTEQHWIARCQQGDPAAFEELIKQYQRMVHSLAYRMTGSLADAEDVAQEAFIRAYQQIRFFRGDASFSSWIYRIAVNTCLNWKKSAQRRDELHKAWASDQDAPTPNDELTAKVQEALLTLNPKQRAAMILTTYQGMNHAEAAHALGCSETTVSWRVFMARKKLRKLLKGMARQP